MSENSNSNTARNTQCQIEHLKIPLWIRIKSFIYLYVGLAGFKLESRGECKIDKKNLSVCRQYSSNNQYQYSQNDVNL